MITMKDQKHKPVMHCIESIGYDFYYGILLKKFQ